MSKLPLLTKLKIAWRMAGRSENWCSGAPDFDIGYCCHRHDTDYEIGGTEKDRKVADEKLKQCISFRGVVRGEPERYTALAEIYYRVVRWRIIGWMHFNYHKNKELDK